MEALLGRLAPSKLRRPAAALVLGALALGLAGCGGDDTTTADRLDAVDISGDPGSAPTFDWKSQMSAGKAESETLTEGDGAALADGDMVMVNYAIGNGFTEQTSVDTYGAKDPGGLVTVGADPAQASSAADILSGFIASQVTSGMTLGTRLAITVNSNDAFGTPGSTTPTNELAALAAYDIGNDDSLVFVVDLVAKPLAAPKGAAKRAAAWAPAITEAKGVPSALDFDGTPEPSGDLLTTTLVQGTGDTVEKGDLLVANYLGQVYGADAPFDASYARGAPTGFGIGIGQVVPGWDKELVGVKVGSRVILQIPPADGYGKQGNQQAGITGTDTLYFVIDILGAV